MADKGKATSNTPAKVNKSEGRKSGKAWSKAHNAAPKILSEATQKRRAEHKLAVARRIRHEPGSPTTMPEINWDWFQDIMTYRWPSTRRLRSIDNHMAQTRGKRRYDESVPVVVVTQANSEDKKPSGARPSRKSIAKANAAARKDGRR